jgi:hypothetical protein
MSMFSCIFKDFDILYVIINVSVKEIHGNTGLKGYSDAKFNEKRI